MRRTTRSPTEAGFRGAARRLADADLLTVHSRESGNPQGPASCQNQDLRDYRILRIRPARVFGLAIFPVMRKAQVARSGIRMAKPFPAPFAIWRRSRTPLFATIVCPRDAALATRLRQPNNRAVRPVSAMLQDERARLRLLLLMRAAARRAAAESGRRPILLRALRAEPRAVWRWRLL